MCQWYWNAEEMNMSINENEYENDRNKRKWN